MLDEKLYVGRKSIWCEQLTVSLAKGMKSLPPRSPMMSPLSSEIYWIILAMNCQMMPSTVVFLQGMFKEVKNQPQKVIQKVCKL